VLAAARVVVEGVEEVAGKPSRQPERPVQVAEVLRGQPPEHWDTVLQGPGRVEGLAVGQGESAEGTDARSVVRPGVFLGLPLARVRGLYQVTT
jgi:hypothetical protein